MKEKILQIIPAPTGLNAYFNGGKLNEQGIIIAEMRPVSCLALIEEADREGNCFEVRAMCPAQDWDRLTFASEIDGFLAIAQD